MYKIIYDYAETIEEAIQLKREVMELIDKFNLFEPDDVDGIISVEPNDDDPTGKSVNVIKKNNISDKAKKNVKDIKPFHTINVKTGKILQKMFPDVDNATLNVMASQYKSEIMKKSYKFVLEDDISNNYIKCEIKGGVSSCTNADHNEKELLNVYDNNPDIKLLVLYNEVNIPIGRALVWTNVEGQNTYFMDRIYTDDNNDVIRAFINYSDSKGWTHKFNQKYEDYRTTANNIISYTFERQGDYMIMPFVDTMQYCIIYPDKMIITNSKPGRIKNVQVKLLDQYQGTKIFFKFPAWVQNATYVNMDAKWDDEFGLIFYDGEWLSGDFVKGIWAFGTWKGGKWHENLIMDHERFGNALPEWKWTDNKYGLDGKKDFVMSPIDPDKYFNDELPIESFLEFLIRENRNR